MKTEASERDGNAQGTEFTLTAENTFGFLPGPMTGVSCPSCFKDQLLKEVISEGSCTHCGATLELTLAVAE